MMRVRQKDIRAMIASGAARDAAKDYHGDVEAFHEKYRGYEAIAHSVGVYGVNGGIYRHWKTGELAAVCGRCSALFILG